MTPPERRKYLLTIVPLAIVLAVVILFGGQWYLYAISGEPYDEVGIGINSHMPGPMRRWACVRIAERHPGTLPPYGCG